MKEIKNKILSIFLSLAMVLTMIPMGSVTVFADLNSAAACTEHPENAHYFVTGTAEDGYIGTLYIPDGTFEDEHYVNEGYFETDPINSWYYIDEDGENFYVCTGHGGSGTTPPTCNCTDGTHSMHVYVYKIEYDAEESENKIYFYMYQGQTYTQSDSCYESDFEDSFPVTAAEGLWIYLGEGRGTCTEAGGSGGGTTWGHYTGNGKEFWYDTTYISSERDTKSLIFFCSAHEIEVAVLERDTTWKTYNLCDHATETDPDGGSTHTHGTWNYEVESTSTLNATCGNEGCTDPKYTVSLTLTASSANYSGIEGLDAFNAATGKTISTIDVEIYKVNDANTTTGGEKVTGTPSEDGYYYASLTVEGQTAVKAFTIGTPGGSGSSEPQKIGESNTYWAYDDTTNTLTISGTGAMPDWNGAQTPWRSYIQTGETDVSLTIVSDITVIGGDSFYNGSLIKSVSFAENSKLTAINEFAFYGCGITSINIPKSVTSIGRRAFRLCKNLQTVTVNALTPPTLGESVFDSCHADLKIAVPANKVDTYKADPNWSAYADKIVAISHSHSFTYTADENVLTATCANTDGECALTDNKVSLSLTASNTNYSGSPVTKADIFGGMDFATFNNATKLNLSAADIKIYAATDTSKATELSEITEAGSYVADLTVDGNTASCTVKVFKGAQIGTSTTYWAYDDTTKTLTISGEGATPDFRMGEAKPWAAHRTEIENVVFESGITRIGSRTQQGSSLPGAETNLKTVQFPDTLVEIGELAFTVAGFEEIEFPASLKKIENNAFEFCDNLKAITINGDDIVIGENAFAYMDSLETVTISGDRIVIGDRAFLNCEAIETVSISGKDIVVGTEAFHRTEALTSLTLKGDNMTIKDNAFYGCGLEEVTLEGKGMTLIGTDKDDDPTGVFAYSQKLKKITIKGDDVTVADYALCAIQHLEEVVFEGANATLGSSILNHPIAGAPTDLTKVEFKKNAKEIASDAFDGIKVPMLFDLVLASYYKADDAEDFSLFDLSLSRYITDPEHEQLKADFEAMKSLDDIRTVVGGNMATLKTIPAGDPSVELVLPTGWALDEQDADGKFYGGLFVKPDLHEHNFTYSVSTDGATLIATCDAENCGLTENKVSLALSASSANYSGSPAEITIGTTDEITAWEGAGLTVPTTVSYTKEDGTALGEEPTAAGSYVAKVSPVGVTPSASNTAKVSYTILQAPGTFEDLIATLKTDGTLVKLTKDYQRSAGENGIYISSGKVNIDLNGHTIDGAKDSGTYAYIFYVGEGCELTISDSSNGNGVITGCTGYKSDDKAYGGAIFNLGTVTINGGKFTDNSGDFGGVIFNNGTVTINDGVFTDNTASSAGGVVLNNKGILTITGGVFTDNTADEYGGVVNNLNTSTITGGVFTNNKATKQGGVINSTAKVSVLTITGGTFTGNSAIYGGVLVQNKSTSLEITGGTFTDNTATSNGGAIYTAGAPFKLGGPVVIKDNKIGDNANNLSYAGGEVTLSDTGFTSDAEIGVTLANTVDTFISTGANLSVLSHIKSDDNTKMFVVNNGALKSETKASHVHSGSATCQTQGTCQTCGQSYYGEHNYGYSATDNILKYACQTSGCTEGVTLTLSANSATYSGNAVTANYGDGEADAWKTATGDDAPEIAYEYKSTANGTYATATDTKNAGYYKASATVGTGTSAKTAVKEFQITKANITPSVTLSGWTYGASANTPSVTGNTANGAVTYTYKVKDAADATYSTTVPTNAGDYTVKVTIAETDNYNTGSATANFTIAQKEVTVEGITAVNKAYDEKTSVELDYTNVTFTGKLGTDTLTVTATGTMADAKIGTNKEVTLSNLVLGGADASNYIVSNSSQTTTKVTVYPVMVNKVEGDFNVTTETPSKEFIVGTTSEASIHINGLELTDMNKVDDVYKGILVMNGETVLAQGTEYTVTSGSVKVNLTKSYLDKLPVGTHNIKVYVKQNGVAATDNKDYQFDVNVVIKAKPSTGGGSTTPTTTPSYKVPNTSVGQDINPMNKTIGLLSIALVAGCVARKKKED